MINLLLLNHHNSSSIQKLRNAKGDAVKLQAAINDCVREGCSVKDMERHLRRAGVPKDQITTLIAAAYPAA